MHTRDEQIMGLLRSAPELARLCTQNGWIDNDSLSFERLGEDGEGPLLAVYFDEILMEGAGCVAGRTPCYGRVRVEEGSEGEPVGLQVVWP